MVQALVPVKIHKNLYTAKPDTCISQGVEIDGIISVKKSTCRHENHGSMLFFRSTMS